MRVGRFRIKDRITLFDMGECDRAKIAAEAATTEAEAVFHLKKIVRTLCTKWSSMLVFKRDLRRVDKILLAAGFQMGKEKTEYDPDWLINLTSWISAYLGGKLAHEVATGMTSKEAEVTAKMIGRKEAMHFIKLWRIQHDPEDILKELTEDIKKLAVNEAEEIKLTAPPQKISFGDILKKAYQA